MKFLLILSCLVLYVALVSGQTCRGAPTNPNCNGGRDEGAARQAPGGPRCNPQPNDSMWYFNRPTGKCIKMSYKGCYGNNNRYCSLRSCEAACPVTRP
ncbi:male accessory gland serine protease inhibitor-like [Drosophila rhopaloa]|uniref:Male accessory gland serine protease inhibitor-like n=1 Tax=Drosophila rhopaloa TaxID=1041015 RepID=A0A6P4DWD0_DRORH|nr:male accessory gland serine protease inhibitor-like [Drosophila rhopaloa]